MREEIKVTLLNDQDLYFTTESSVPFAAIQERGNFLHIVDESDKSSPYFVPMCNIKMIEMLKE